MNMKGCNFIAALFYVRNCLKNTFKGFDDIAYE